MLGSAVGVASAGSASSSSSCFFFFFSSVVVVVVAAGAAGFVVPAPGIPPIGTVTPRGLQISLAKATVAAWSASEQEDWICAPTARMKALDWQMQVKFVRLQDVLPTPEVTGFC